MKFLVQRGKAECDGGKVTSCAWGLVCQIPLLINDYWLRKNGSPQSELYAMKYDVRMCVRNFRLCV